MMRKTKVKCSVVNCENNTFNSPHLQFYRFPTSNPLFPHKSERRKIWVTAVRRQGPGKSAWQPTQNHRICGEHFVGAKKSEDPRSPSYNPTIFPDIYKKIPINAVVATQRYERRMKREYGDRQVTAGENSNKAVQQTENFEGSKSLDREVQVDFHESSVNRQDIFICNRIVYLNKCDVETQAYRPRMLKCETNDQEVQTDSLLRDTLKTEGIEIKVEDLHHCINIKEEPSILEYQPDEECKPDSSEKPFACEFCKYKFTRSHHLKMHLRIHTGEKPYTCEFCNYKCALKENFQAHIRTHTGEKPFACEFCDFKCARTGTLKVHVRTHTGEKPFTCDMCDYKSAHKDTFKLHLRTHSGEKPFTCKFCNYKCARKEHLKIHVRIHTGEKPFTCEICDYKSALKINLNKHLKTHTDKSDRQEVAFPFLEKM